MNSAITHARLTDPRMFAALETFEFPVTMVLSNCSPPSVS
jgi:hypothetical protein